MENTYVSPQGLDLVQAEIERVYHDVIAASADSLYQSEVLFELAATMNYLYKAHVSIKKAVSLRDNTAQLRLPFSDGHCYGWEKKAKKGGEQ